MGQSGYLLPISPGNDDNFLSPQFHKAGQRLLARKEAPRKQEGRLRPRSAVVLSPAIAV